jgi:hypothetical protein
VKGTGGTGGWEGLEGAGGAEGLEGAEGEGESRGGSEGREQRSGAGECLNPRGREISGAGPNSGIDDEGSLARMEHSLSGR